MRILVVNAGSSSLKLRVLDDQDGLAGSQDLPTPNGRSDARMISDAIEGFGPIDAVGHRIVHGATEFSGPVLIDREVEERLGALVDLAPLHQPKSLAALTTVCAVLPGVPAVACFDTAFHGGHLRPPARMAGAMGAQAVRVPRALARVRVASGGRACRTID